MGIRAKQEVIVAVECSGGQKAQDGCSIATTRNVADEVAIGIGVKGSKNATGRNSHRRWAKTWYRVVERKVDRGRRGGRDREVWTVSYVQGILSVTRSAVVHINASRTAVACSIHRETRSEEHT